jgi:hypothetical protein
MNRKTAKIAVIGLRTDGMEFLKFTELFLIERQIPIMI